MASNFTLDDIRAAAEKKYGDTPITFGDEELILLNPLRLDKESRKKLMSIQEDTDKDSEDEADQADRLEEALLLVAKHKPTARKYLKELGGDLTLLAATFEHYTESTSAGEASASQD